MKNTLSFITFLCDDYDKAKNWFTSALGFVCLEDTPQEDRKRWVLLAPSQAAQTCFLLAKASTAEQSKAVGNQCGGRVGFFLNTDAFDEMYNRMLENGVTFRERPRDEPYGKVVVFEDLYGQPWDLLQLKASK